VSKITDNGVALALGAVALVEGIAWWQSRRGSPAEDSFGKHLIALLGMLRAQKWQYWVEHWKAQGKNFYGDHLLFERLYTGPIDAQIDGLAERIVATFGSGAIDNERIEEFSRKAIARWASIADPIDRALLSEEEIQTHLGITFEVGKRAGMSLGLDDFLMGLASEHDVNVYLLTQRKKS